jgi:hypothetical protein
VLTGVFARKVWGATGDGLLGGGFGLFSTQLLGLLAAVGYAAAMSLVLLKAIDRLVGLRLHKDEEREGLDAVLHGESGYELSQVTGSSLSHGASVEREREPSAPRSSRRELPSEDEDDEVSARA